MEHIKGHNSNIPLQRAIKKYGLEAFEFIVVEFVEDTSLLTTREQVHLDWLFSVSSELRYNICPTAESRLGTTHTDESKALMCERKSGGNNPKSGKTHTAETKAAMSAQKLGNTNRLGTTHTAETKAKMSAAKMGNTHFLGKTQTAESIDLNRLNQPSRISVFVYDRITIGEFLSQNEAAKFLKCNISNVS